MLTKEQRYRERQQEVTYEVDEAPNPIQAYNNLNTVTESVSNSSQAPNS